MDDKQILEIFQEEGDPVLFTGEVADRIGFSNQGALPRLKDLEEEGLLKSKRGGKVLVWWLSEEGREYLEREA
ncbi:winged helix-turn-helix transcriptional regulator [Halolamina salifodinae]|uniref:Mn-dependent DtxR family transcriptional regulator n=1 Tax=Halolamina salifodinae TaxID=1202767 RepID=A0A8T4GW54_9EURY|nr:winged helix-turn-helix transcriptional regulator [Halolamina salifodinae]MBP1987217.1 Mn-dependent DtxR family transcriptional regulator [Halolamina salifodinae]